MIFLQRVLVLQEDHDNDCSWFYCWCWQYSFILLLACSSFALTTEGMVTGISGRATTTRSHAKVEMLLQVRLILRLTGVRCWYHCCLRHAACRQHDQQEHHHKRQLTALILGGGSASVMIAGPRNATWDRGALLR